MNRIKTKSVVQGAMIAALFGMLSLLNTYTGGMIDIFICYAMVIPVAWYGYQYNIKLNILVSIASIIVIMMFGMPFFIISSFSSLVIGVFLGEMIKRKAKKEYILLGTLAICLLNNIMIYYGFSGLLGMDIVSEMKVMHSDLSLLYPPLANVSIDVFLNLIPLVILLMSGMEMYVIILLCQLIFMRLKIEFPSNFHIATMHLSFKTGIVLMIAMAVSYLLMNYFKLDNIVVKYIYLLSQVGFVLQGFSLVNLYAVLLKKRWIIILSFLLFIIPMGTTLLIILGIVDIFSDLRRNLLYNSNG